ncbi:hypothetical protein ACFQPG_10515 [Sphingomonas sp. GCM10030256]|uniref:hypothetical protein n=1 Tax=Sphingomonas sp. GCM10030256 TaxID=3273427 RepID=UPI003605B485
MTAQRDGTAIVSVDDNVDTGFPSYFRAAMRTVLRPGERLERVAPRRRLYEPREVGWTSRGHVLLAVPGDDRRNVCVVEASGWPDLAMRVSPVAQEFVQSCWPLFSEVKDAWMKRIERSLEQHPIIAQASAIASNVVRCLPQLR